MKLTIVSAWDELPDSARKLIADVGRDRLFCSDSWFAVFSRNVAEAHQQSRWLLLNHEDATLIVLPMMEWHHGGMKILSSLSNYYTPYYQHIGPAGDDVDLLRRLFELAAGFLQRYDAIEFSPLTDESRKSLLRGSETLGFSADSQVQTYNWRQTVIEGFDQYWSTRDSRLRNTVQRKTRRLASMGDFEFTIAEQGQVELAIDDYRLVYSRSWKPDENYPEFIEGLIRVFAQEGNLRLGLAHHAGKPIAAQLWLVNSSEAYIYKLAYDKDYRHLSVGTLLTRHMFEHVIDRDRVHTVDYLTGDDSYKAQWMSERRPLSRLTLANPRTLKGFALTTKHQLRQILRSVRSGIPS